MPRWPGPTSSPAPTPASARSRLPASFCAPAWPPARRKASWWPTAGGGWRNSRSRSGSSSWTPCRRPPAARCFTGRSARRRKRAVSLSSPPAPDPAPAPPAPAGPGRRRLNAADRTLLTIDRALRRLDAPGFETQTFVWLRGRVDPGQLHSALAHLGARHPVTTARLVETAGNGGPYWQLRPGARVALQESRLDSAAPQAV